MRILLEYEVADDKSKMMLLPNFMPKIFDRVPLTVLVTLVLFRASDFAWHLMSLLVMVVYLQPVSAEPFPPSTMTKKIQ